MAGAVTLAIYVCPDYRGGMLTQESQNSHVSCGETWNRCACPCPPWAPFEHLDLRILRCCRQLYNESNQVLWARNIFAFEGPDSLRWFMRASSHIQKQLLSKIYMRQPLFWTRNGTIDKKTSSSFKSLRAVHIVIEDDQDILSAFEPKHLDDIHLIINTDNLFRAFESLNEASVIIKRHASSKLEKATTMKLLRDFAKRVEQRLLDPNGARQEDDQR